jgi:hypothetical protein
MLLAIPVFIIGGIGLLLLVAPGVMWFSYVFTAYNLISAIVVDKPDLGVFGSIKEGFRLLKNNMLRTIGLGLSSLVISIIITLPLSLINGMIGVYLRKAPASASSIGLFVLSAGIHSALSWFSLTVGLCGTVLIMYRYIQDLKARHGEIDESNYNHEPSNLPPGMFGVKR